MLRKALFIFLLILSVATCIAWVVSTVKDGIWVHGQDRYEEVHNTDFFRTAGERFFGCWIGNNNIEFVYESVVVSPFRNRFWTFDYIPGFTVRRQDLIIDKSTHSQFYFAYVNFLYPLLLFISYPLLTTLIPVLRRTYRRKHRLCIECGYNLAGNQNGICPECGERLIYNSSNPTANQ